MVHNASILLFLCAMVVLTYQRGTFFEEIVDENREDGGLVRPPMKEFHQCSMKDDCNFIIQDKMTRKFSRINHERDLPENRGLYNIWRKIKEDETKEAQLSAFNTCKDAWRAGVRSDGPVNIKWNNGSTFQAFCNMTSDGGGWTVIQRRINDGMNFERNWTDYERGFGDIHGSYWLGLAAIRHLTKANKTELRIDLVNSNGRIGYALYSDFYLGSKDENYTLHFDQLKDGNIGDALANHKNLPFSTRDKDNDEKVAANCALETRGAWWHKSCFDANLNSMHPYDVREGSVVRKTMSWRSWNNGNCGGIVYSEMKIK